ncbi:SDR family oxidoreductase [Streptomyces sp. NPDC101150]|uniref:SDR family oxidoreductase n=1 Tax=Streptomyces sp. NPDC101150 TaxID=3366114 RepID=UPI00381DF1BD
MILVTGATGTVGRPLVRALRDRGATVRALVRDAGSVPAEWDDGVEAVVADLNDAGSLVPAADGIDAVYLLTPVDPDAARQARHVIDAAAKAGRPRVVLQAAIGVGRRTSPVRFFAAHAAALDHVKAAGLPWTVLAPNGFQQNFLGSAASLRAGTLALPAGAAAVSYVDARDVGEAAAEVLTTEGHEGAIHELTGPEALTHEEIAGFIGAALGREVVYRDRTPDQARTALLDTGLDAWRASGLVELHGMYAAGEAAAVTDGIPRLLGRPARSLTALLTEHAAALRATPTTTQERPA